jgi:hypothetical protein
MEIQRLPEASIKDFPPLSPEVRFLVSIDRDTKPDLSLTSPCAKFSRDIS